MEYSIVGKGFKKSWIEFISRCFVINVSNFTNVRAKEFRMIVQTQDNFQWNIYSVKRESCLIYGTTQYVNLGVVIAE